MTFNKRKNLKMTQAVNMKEAVLSALKESGKLGKISAEIRAEVTHLLNQDVEKSRSIPLCRENLIINELIRDYLALNGYKHTLSIFVPETGDPIDPIDRNFLAHSLRIIPNETTTLMNTLLRKWKNDENPQMRDSYFKETKSQKQSAPFDRRNQHHTSNMHIIDPDDCTHYQHVENINPDKIEFGGAFEITSV